MASTSSTNKGESSIFVSDEEGDLVIDSSQILQAQKKKKRLSLKRTSQELQEIATDVEEDKLNPPSTNHHQKPPQNLYKSTNVNIYEGVLHGTTNL